MQVPNWMPIIFYAVVTMLFVGVYARIHVENTSERKPFSNLVFITAFMLVNDFISRLYIYDGFPTFMVVVCTYINFAVLPVIGVFWYFFVRSVLSAEERIRVGRMDYLVYIIGVLGLLPLVLNVFTGMVFSFDSMGDYHRGPLFFFPAGSTFLCIVIAEIFLSLRVRSLGRSMYVSMLLFPLPPLIGGIVAMFAYGIPWMPLGISISMVVLFAVLQNTSLGTDFLTGLLNRKKFDELLDERCAWAQRGHTFAAIMIDLDDFKTINDTLGHNVGDIALAEAAGILKRSAYADNVVARLSGDEFAILLDVTNEKTVENLIARINTELAQFNAQNTQFKLAMSMGYEIYKPEEYVDSLSFLKTIDARMYANKQKRKAIKHEQQAS